MSPKFQPVGESKGEDRGKTDDQNRDPDTGHTIGNTTDDQRGRARLAIVSQVLGRREFVARGVLRPFADQPAGQQANDNADRHAGDRTDQRAFGSWASARRPSTTAAMTIRPHEALIPRASALSRFFCVAPSSVRTR